MFEFFPQLIIILAVAVVIVLIARKFPKLNEENIEESLNKENQKKEAKRIAKEERKRVQQEKKAEKNEDKGEVDKIIAGENKDGEVTSDSEKNTTKKEDEIKEVDPEAAKKLEKEKTLETKRELHQNALKVIDRVVFLSKKTGRLVKIKSIAIVAFIRTKKAELSRKRRPISEVSKEKMVDLLEKAAKELGASKFKEAEKNYIEVIKLDPKNIRAFKGLGELYEKQKNFKDSIASYEEVIKRDPLDSEASRKLMELRPKLRDQLNQKKKKR
ncbi:tetratricopeptide repeat protein [Patescibacteria group bacterium]|nr:tetratricopeptide repeat protein [Patescibacteria group bacterium]